MIKIDYNGNRQIMESFYDHLGLAEEFEKDNIYLERAFNEIRDLWIANFNKIDKVNYLLIAESPLWGHKKKYIYNPETNNTQFFYRSDLGEILNFDISDKKKFIEVCNEIGLLIVDISPFPLNIKDTKINYAKNENGSVKLSKDKYRKLVSLTIPTFFERKIKLVGHKRSSDINVFFRYTRVKNAFQDLISEVLIENGLIKKQEDISDIAQRGGGIDRIKFSNIINVK
ncbi:MAG TPA: hypothetical protein VFM99_11155 [Chitinophagales bacterium]|nr:hypothetical protein [Chitinophagales bacterium]